MLDDVDDASEIEIENLREVLGSRGPLGRQALREPGESGNVGEQQGRRKMFRDRIFTVQAPVVGALNDQLRQITCERLQIAGHGYAALGRYARSTMLEIVHTLFVALKCSAVI